MSFSFPRFYLWLRQYEDVLCDYLYLSSIAISANRIYFKLIDIHSAGTSKVICYFKLLRISIDSSWFPLVPAVKMIICF